MALEVTVLKAFREACDGGDLEVAERLLVILEEMDRRVGSDSRGTYAQAGYAELIEAFSSKCGYHDQRSTTRRFASDLLRPPSGRSRDS